MDEHGAWSEDQNAVLQIFPNEFCRHFKKYPNVDQSQAVSLSRDITSVSNGRLIREPSDHENFQRLHQTSPLKALGPDGICAIF